MASNSESGSSDHGNNPELPSSSGIVVERLPAPVIPSETISRIETIVNHIVQDEPEVGAMVTYSIFIIRLKFNPKNKYLVPLEAVRANRHLQKVCGFQEGSDRKRDPAEA